MSFLTVPQLAESLGCDQQKIIEWIARGELIAVNIASNPRGARPRWRILPSEWERFLAARQSQPPAPPARRKKRDSAVIEFYK